MLTSVTCECYKHLCINNGCSFTNYIYSVCESATQLQIMRLQCINGGRLTIALHTKLFQFHSPMMCIFSIFFPVFILLSSPRLLVSIS